ncbi:hypothetical protein NE555_16585, partial [Alistipes onderdonkii]|uniref:hypothetical protein n=1 Tax=Alistipes onderdonkii TaxID=328813 RepID=UPI00210A0D15
NIAMQDLDIRGASNLLGAEQSGFIADIGFETYQKIMNEAIAELRAEGLQVAGLGAAEQDVVERALNAASLSPSICCKASSSACRICNCNCRVFCPCTAAA